MSKPLFPEVIVPLLELDSNAFMLIGHSVKMARRANIPKEDIDAFRAEAMSGDYDQVLRTIMKYFSTDSEEDWS